MNAKEKAPAGGTAEAMTEMAARNGAQFPCLNCTMTATGRQDRMKIFNVLPRERKNALKLPELKQLFNLDGRAVRAMIQKERRSYPILTDNKSGYWVSYSKSHDSGL